MLGFMGSPLGRGYLNACRTIKPESFEERFKRRDP